jgi:glutamate racemase
MRIALINSGIGLLAAAAELHRLRPDADLVLAMDPDGMPWGPRTPADITQRSLACARAAAAFGPDVLVFACNTGTVHALPALRAEFEPALPVVGTVPAIKPAAAFCDSVAIWATVATTASTYQRRLIDDFAGSARVTPVACPGLADAVDAGDEAAARAAVAAAAARTPADCRAVVLGCTEYELAAELIGAALPGVTLFRSAPAVAAQALRRAAAAGADTGHATGPSTGHATGPDRPADADAGAAARSRTGTVRVLLSGRQAGLPEAALHYAEGRLLAGLVAARPGEGVPGDRVPRDGLPADGLPGEDFPGEDLPAEDFLAEARPADDFRGDDFPGDGLSAADLAGDEAPAGLAAERPVPPNSVPA